MQEVNYNSIKRFPGGSQPCINTQNNASFNPYLIIDLNSVKTFGLKIKINNP
jgi:hypothetical protein